VARRNPEADQPILWVMEGQKSFWAAGQRDVPKEGTIAILDLWHAPPSIWDAAPRLDGREEAPVLHVGDDRVLRLLKGDVRSVLAGLRPMGTQRARRGQQRDKLAQICGDLENQAPRMPDDVYLAAGSPLASGVIEGACRHFVQDRMEHSGMRWTIESAQAMLDVRSPSLHGDGDDFMRYRLEKETQRVYPYRALGESIDT
jgi:hypothetical protein